MHFKRGRELKALFTFATLCSRILIQLRAEIPGVMFFQSYASNRKIEVCIMHTVMRLLARENVVTKINE